MEKLKWVQKNEMRLIEKSYQQNVITNHIHLIYMYKEDLTLDILQRLICHKTKPNQTKPPISAKNFKKGPNLTLKVKKQ